ncbi:MAG: hypothetical protein ACRDYU_02495 [Actinomycetes bacterium]
MEPCRADRAVAGPWTRWLPLLAFALFVTGFLAAERYVRHIDAADRFAGIPQFDLWAVLIGALVGLALSSGLYYVVWLTGVARLCEGARVRTVLGWTAVALLVLATPFVVLFLGTDAAAPSLDRTVARQTRPITLVAGLFQLPGLVAFLGLRQVATTTALWTESGQCTLRLVLRLRAELRRLLATLGAFLTLLVIATGMRRRAFVALDPSTSIPPESVLLYGLVFAVLLGAFYVVAASAIDARSDLLLDQYAPLPDLAAEDFPDRVGRRDALAGVIGSGGSWHTFQTTVVIAAPLLTALIGSALGS